jgi:phosphoribosylformylglycinamidine cyclo-ligase
MTKRVSQSASVGMRVYTMSKYAKLGVDVKKKGIEHFQSLVDNLYPTAFCVISQDPDFPDKVECMHTDGAGSKPIQSYLHWREKGDTEWFRGLAQDVLAMNVDDVACVGVLRSPIFVDYVAINTLKLPKQDVLRALRDGFEDCLDVLRKNGTAMRFAGGETADLPDQLRTLDISGTIHAKAEKDEILTGARIKEGDIIIGLRSGGKTKYEKKLNSGIMCNFITLARHCLMKKDYGRKHPEVRDPNGGEYYGRFAFDEFSDELGITVGEAILSPTRLFTPVVQETLRKFRPYVKGLIHNTGGGQTKCLRLGESIHYVKDRLPNPDPIFHLIQRESEETWRNMYMGGNMGVGLEVIVDPEVADDVLSVPESFGLGAQIIGECGKSKEGNKLTIQSPLGKFQYR